jgi:SAM-dependent methyltransferase
MVVPPERFAKLSYEDFKALARDPGLSVHEKIAFPDSYRDGMEAAILDDMRRKLPALDRRRCTVVDIGTGCGALAHALIAHCSRQEHALVLVDSQEMLEQLPESAHVKKVAGRFPQKSGPALAELRGQADAVVVYSVFHYVFADANPFEFVDAAVALLKEGGRLLIGDIPNDSQRRRFFSSEAGRAFHRQFTRSDSDPVAELNRREPGPIDDAVVLGLVARCRAAGFDGYVLPQSPDLPMGNRREDILILRP